MILPWKLNRRQLLFTLLTVLCIFLIFGNSMQPASVSSMQSGDVKKTIDSLLAFFGIPVTMSEFLIRKAAHFTEYTVLGVLLILTLRSFTDRLMQHIFQPLFVGLAVPVTDEFIQLHVDGRAGLITDVILDFSGVFTGLMLTVLLILIRKRGKKREGGLPKRIRNGTL